MRAGGAGFRCRSSGLAGLGVFAQVADEADDVLRDEPPDGAAGVHAAHDPAVGVQHEAGRLQEGRVGLTNAPVASATAAASALWPTGNRRPCRVIRSRVVASSSTDSARTAA